MPKVNVAIHFLILLFLYLLLNSCEGSENTTFKSCAIDVIIVNGKGDINIEEYDEDELSFKNTDSIRIDLRKQALLEIEAKGFNTYYSSLYPWSSFAKGKDGVDKIYITLPRVEKEFYHVLPERKSNQRDLNLVGSSVYSTFRPVIVSFENGDNFKDAIRDLGLDALYRNNSVLNYSVRHLKNGLVSNSSHDYLKWFFDQSGYESNEPFERNEDELEICLKVDSMRVFGIEQRFSSVQMFGNWVLRDHFGEVLYKHPIRSYYGGDRFELKQVYELNEFGKGSSVLGHVSEILKCTLNDALHSDSIQFFLDKKNKLFDGGKEQNKFLEPIVLNNLKSNGKSRTIEEVIGGAVLVSNEAKNDFGSGSVVSSDGYILTNYHVINSFKENIKVTLNDGTQYDAELVRWDKNVDLALLKIDHENLTVIQIEDSYEPKLGEKLISIGAPSSSLLANSVVSSHVAGFRTVFDTKYIQTDGNGNSGMSGGPLLNSRNNQIGIRVWGWKSNSATVYGINFDINIQDALNALNLRLSY